MKGLVELSVVEEAEYDRFVRAAAFAYVDRLVAVGHGVVSFEDVSAFVYDGERMTLMDRQRGIRKPARLDAALSIRTVHPRRPDMRPYNDGEGVDGYLRYKWRGEDSQHPENRALREAYRQRLPLIWFRGIAQGLYLPVYPVWLAAEEPAEHQFVIALDDGQLEEWSFADVVDLSSRRRYAERTVRARLHQPEFRARVLHAYATRCAICRLRHPELLDAAHILSDAEGGEPVVPNGISMCKIHHAAFDNSIIGIRPDHCVEVRADIRAEEDGPTLRYALQQVHGTRIELPALRSARPDSDLVLQRYERFQAAG